MSPLNPFAACAPDGSVNFPNSEVEPFVAVNPTDPSNIIGVYQQDRYADGASKGTVAAVSHDGGATWTQVPVPTLTRCTGGPFDRERVRPALSPAIPIHCSDEFVVACRDMAREFGCGIHDHVFESVDAYLVGRIEQEVRIALDRWEPRIEVLTVELSVERTTQGGVLDELVVIDIAYKLRATNDVRNLVHPFYIIPAEE